MRGLALIPRIDYLTKWPEVLLFRIRRQQQWHVPSWKELSAAMECQQTFYPIVERIFCSRS